ncbi:aspartate--tRNA(Asn) ligase [Candidatus Micrarchaeota archaeon RBG_16_49_10]|nr:MAG: aspartate--tRNA(Asn) ligase [Candidatus Micrarchaeota archaeon RBG_16_49_10]
MGLTKINELKNKVGERVVVNGWVHETRDQSKIKFILLRDVSGIAQAIVTDDNKAVFDNIARVPRESVISVGGVVKAAKITNKDVTERDFEVSIDKFTVLSQADTQLPIQVSEKNDTTDLSKRLDYRWLDLRKPRNALIFKIQTAMEMAMREYWVNNGFIEIHSPKLMGFASESGAELFSVSYFDKEAFLAQSPQFYKQMAMASGFERVFEIGPVFRANQSHTTRHDTEFTSIDVEMSFIDSHEDIMKFEERWLVYVIEKLKDRYGKEIKETFGVDLSVPKLPFPRLSLEEVHNMIKETGRDVSYEEDLTPEEERIISKIVKEKYNHEFVFVKEFPWKIKPFYHMRDEKNPKVTKGFDLLWNGLEVTTGAQREHRYDVLLNQAKEKGLNLGSVNFFLNFFKYGCPPHGGFGFGLTRALICMLNLSNVREVTFVFRDIDRLIP